jgi:hypothetical protein
MPIVPRDAQPEITVRIEPLGLTVTAGELALPVEAASGQNPLGGAQA